MGEAVGAASGLDDVAAEGEAARRREELDLIAWARSMLDDLDTVVLDTGTTGVHKQARIVEIGVQTVSGEVPVDTLVDPGEPNPTEATAIRGITDAMVAGPMCRPSRKWSTGSPPRWPAGGS